MLPNVESAKYVFILFLEFLIIEEEIIVLSCIGLIGKSGKVEWTELKTMGICRDELTHTLEKLNKDRRLFLGFLSLKTHSIVERMAETDKFFLYQYIKPVDSPIVRVYNEFCKSCHLTGPV